MSGLELRKNKKEQQRIRDVYLGHTEDKGQISDGYHTFDELYEHRHLLYLSLIASESQHGTFAWKSKLHEDGSFYEGYFLAGLYLPYVDKYITYHLPMKYWDLCGASTLEKAYKWDGHTSNDVLNRLKEYIKSIV